MSGYGMLGFSQGLASGMGLGMQFKNMKWQNDERKKLEQKAKDTEDALSNFFGSSHGQTMVAGGNLSKDDQTNFMTGLQGATAEARGIMLETKKAWKTGDKEEYARCMDKLDIILNFYGSGKFDTENTVAALDALAATFTNQDALNAVTAGKNMIAGRKKEFDTGRLDIVTQGAGTGSEAAYAEINRLLGTDYKPEAEGETRGKVLNSVNVALSNAAALGKSAFTTVKNQMALDPKYKDTGIAWDNVTFEGYTTKPVTETAPANVAEVKSSLGSIEDAPDAKTAGTFASTYERDHGKGSLANLGITEDVGQYWASKQTYILDNISRDLETLVNVKGFVEPELQTERNLLGPKQTKTNAEWYQALYGEYMSLYNEMAATGMDMTGIQKLAKISDIKKITSKTLWGGTKQGDWRSGGWFMNE